MRAIALLLVLLLSTCAAMPVARAEGGVSVLFINVGRADAALIELDGRAYLVDVGTKESAPALLGALALRGVERLDAVFLSHTHSDHVGGLEALAGRVPIDVVYSAEISEPKKNGENKIAAKAEKLGLRHVLLRAGDALEMGDGARVTVLAPRVYNEADDNDNSLLLLLEAYGARFLFTGDMQFAEEATLAGADLRADVLKVANHGNPDATGNAFAAIVSPSVAVISTDTREDEDSANPRVYEALSGANVYVTQDYEVGVLVRAEGGVAVEAIEAPEAISCDLATDVDADAQTVTLTNLGAEAIDLSGWMFLSERGGELFEFPAGASLAAGASCVVAAEGGTGTYVWAGQDEPWSRTKDDRCLVFDRFGRLVNG